MNSHLVGAEGDVGAEDDGVALGGCVGVEARDVAVVDGRLVGAQVEEVPQIEEQVGGGHRCGSGRRRRGAGGREIREGALESSTPLCRLVGLVIRVALREDGGEWSYTCNWALVGP